MTDETNVQEEEVLEDNPSTDDEGTDSQEGTEEPEVEVGSDLSGDDEDGGEEGDDDRESRQARKDRAKAQIERLKEENRRLKEEARKQARGEKVGATNTDMMAKAFLAATYDIKEPDAQEEALRLADKFEMSVDELMEDPDYKQRISGLQKRIVQQRRVAANTGGAAQRKKGAEYAADYFKKHNEFPQGVSLEVKDQAIDLLTSNKARRRWQT